MLGGGTAWRGDLSFAGDGGLRTYSLWFGGPGLIHPERIAVAKDNGPLDNTSQLLNVARPRIRLILFEGIGIILEKCLMDLPKLASVVSHFEASPPLRGEPTWHQTFELFPSDQLDETPLAAFQETRIGTT